MLLRATFKHLHPHLADGSNPFHGLVTKATETVNREPFKVEELKAITDACADDDFIRPIIVTGMCSAMRRGDCCLLNGITWRVKQVLAKALETGRDSSALPVEAGETVRAKGLAYIDGLGATSKAGNMRAVFTAYMEGQTLDQVMAATDCSRGAVSGYLNELERETGCAIVRGKRRALKTDGLQAERENGRRRASIHDFHSFRVTWITLALAAGVPLELVQRVTGHRTVEVVMKHYFRPGREDFRTAIFSAMRNILANAGRRLMTDEMRDVVQQVTCARRCSARRGCPSSYNAPDIRSPRAFPHYRGATVLLYSCKASRSSASLPTASNRSGDQIWNLSSNPSRTAWSRIPVLSRTISGRVSRPALSRRTTCACAASPLSASAVASLGGSCSTRATSRRQPDELITWMHSPLPGGQERAT